MKTVQVHLIIGMTLDIVPKDIGNIEVAPGVVSGFLPKVSL